jgi:methionyl-tRNA formyltransferase
LKINDARITDTALQSGEINQKGEVGTGKGSIALLEITPSGKKRMAVKDWLNGFKVIDGERFE